MAGGKNQPPSESQHETDILLLQQIFGATGATGVTGVSSGGSTPDNPPAPSTSLLQLLLSTIPVATEGHVITSEYHNSLRAALLAIASAIGVTPGGAAGPQDVTVTLLPAFFPGIIAPWLTILGVAGLPQGQPSAQGWLPVTLPDGVIVKSMTVFGKKQGTPSQFSVAFERQEIIAGDFDDIITINLTNSPVDYNVTKAFQGAAGLNEIDNKKYKYLIDAAVTRPGGESGLMQIYAIQLVYTTT
jgi:hypothetical protein